MRKNYVLETLLDKGEVSWKPKGNSMAGKISSGEEVFVKKVPLNALRVGDAVYAKVKGSYYLHLLSAINEKENKYLISNNKGRDNGWTSGENVFGLCLYTESRVFVSDTDLEKRISE